jgi:hypothetical protein
MKGARMRSTLRILSLLMILVIMITAGSSNVFAGRRVTGNGGTLFFQKGQSVAGEVIKLRGGKTFYRCKMPRAPQRGKVTSGVIDYYRSEVQSLRNCKKTLASPGPRRETGNGRWRSFRKGDHVLGYAIEVENGFAGRTYFDCVVVGADAPGRVNSGVVNPSRFEISAMKRHCSRTDNWRPGFRMETGSGSLFFRMGDWIVGDEIRLDNGRVERQCHMVAPTTGIVTRGLRNYWPGEDYRIPPC